MTIKELSDVAGVSISTIRRTGIKLFPERHKQGKTTYYKKDQCVKIIEEVRKKNIIEPVQNEQVLVQNEQVNYKILAEVIGSSIKAALEPVIQRLDQKQLPAIKEDRYSLVAYCQLNEIQVNRSELAKHGMTLKRMAKEKGLTITKIPDERWGQVNSYPIDLLEEYFEI